MSTDAQPQLRRKPEPEYEKLIKVIQNRGGARISREEREAALLKLINQFRYLIRKTARDTWDKSTGERFEDFEHDTMTTFLELVVGDYTPIEFGGASPFGPYIQTKLYFKMKYHRQRAERQYQRFPNTDFQRVDFSPSVHGGLFDGREGAHIACVREAIYEQVVDVESEVIDRMTDAEITEMLHEIREIAKSVLDARERFIWGAYYFSPMQVKDIGSQLEPPIGTSRVNQIVQQARKKVLEELGRRSIARALKR